MKRNLPNWMKKTHTGQKENKVVPKLTLPKSCEVIYSHDERDCSIICDDILSMMQLPTVIGFDVEWKPSFIKGRDNKVAVIQICQKLEKIYVFHVSKMGKLPQRLRDVIENKEVIKIGISVSGDLWKLHRDYDVDRIKTQSSYLDLNDLAQSVLLGKNMRWGLQSLTKYLFGKDLDKNEVVRLGNWDDFPLSNNQLTYAALDAYTSLLIYNDLQNRKERI